MARNTAQFTARMPADLADRLRSAAEAEGRSTGDMMRRLLEKALADRKSA